ncbi:MAG: translation elongation factor 4 [Patescibacteria group bacterium]
MNNINNIRNFVIIAHIDHGKSTLADRMLEITGTIESRHMKPQFLDSLESERERGITIKMAPVRMIYTLNAITYTLNLIDTPGHPDFFYEVSRALAAVEGAILLMDITQGVQAQTLAKFYAAQKIGLKIIGAVNKIDLIKDEAEINKKIKELADLIGCRPEEIYKISGKTGEGVRELLESIIQKIPAPQACADHASALSQRESAINARALIFDSFYSDHKGIVACVRIFDGEFKLGNEAKFIATGEKIKIKDLGYFSPQMKSHGELFVGEIGYIATGLKETEKIKIGDTIIINQRLTTDNQRLLALPGYQEPKPVVFVSFYPEDGDDYENFKKALEKLKLNDSALSFEPDANEVLGRGFKIGFLGKLHFEITAERLKKEFNINIINTFPSVAYKIIDKSRKETLIQNPADLSNEFDEILEPMINLEIIAPIQYLGNVLQLKENFRMQNLSTKNLGERILISAKMPLFELILDFDDRLKSVSEGFASFNYELADYQKADLKKMEILVVNEPVAGLTRIIPRQKLEREARKMTEKLKNILPRQQFTQAIQARADGRIIARETIPAMKKDVTGYLYGGDRTRKMKLWKKQKEGKKKLLSAASVRIPYEVFKKILQ